MTPQHQEDLLDEALAETFPASDPTAVSGEPPRPPAVSEAPGRALEIQHQRGAKGAFYVERDGVRVASLTYTTAGDDLIIIDHTEVDDSLRGQSVGRRLVDAAVAWARAEHKRIMPLCPFARSVFAKDASLRDVLYQ